MAKKKKLSRSFFLKAGVTTVLLLGFLAVVIVLNTPRGDAVPTAASQLRFARARVTAVLAEKASPDTWTESLRLGTQQVYVQLESGEHKGTQLYAVNYLNAYANIDLKVDTRIIVRLDYDESGKLYVASIANYARDGVLIGLMVIFAALMIGFGGKKGVASLAGLLFTVVSIWFFLIPLMQRGFPAILGAVILVAITTAVSLVLLNGFTAKTLCAVIGCIGGVLVAGVTAALAGEITPIGGFNMPESEEIVLRMGDSDLKIRGLLVSGILISALGAVMDTSMSITSSVFELHEMNPSVDRKRLFRSGINIGRDAMGTMSNTLILAFAGTSLNTLLLFRVFDYPYLQIFNSDMMTIEVIQGLAGSIGIVLTVPLVAALSAAMCGGKPVKKR
ncbi:MAG TPA: YibE/F family protein [Clostridia bacterium]|nr:YibE/F family protein [Clostridia bacterium]